MASSSRPVQSVTNAELYNRWAKVCARLYLLSTIYSLIHSSYTCSAGHRTNQRKRFMTPTGTFFKASMT